MSQTELFAPKPVTIPGEYGKGEYVFGDVCPPDHYGCKVATDEQRYLKDSEGNQTGYIRRVKGRPVKDIAADLTDAIKDDENIEWATLGQGYKYKVGTDTPETECPRFDSLIVYYTRGGSEGHLVHVEMVFVPECGVGDGSYVIHKTLYMVKTLMGVEHARQITERLQSLLGVA
jgi:hypothetical protein